MIDIKLNEEMQMVMQLVSLGHAARNSAQVKVRQPLADVAFSLPAGQTEIIAKYADLIADELNVKEVKLLTKAEDVFSYSLNPQPKELGPRFGKEFPTVQQMLQKVNRKSGRRNYLLANPYGSR